MTYTKGPLKITGPSSGDGPYDDGGDHAIYAGGVIIGEAIHRADEDEYRDAEANARLWAAAPDLLAACELVEPAIVSLLDELSQTKATDWGLVNDCLCEVAKAIRKAKGEKK